MKVTFEKIKSLSLQIKQAKPLILNLTNDVTMDFIANGLLSMGASPLMSRASQELNDLVALADVLVINLGTLNEDFIKQCHSACEIANKLAKPIILDPVGAGASRYRTDTALQLLKDYQIAIIRGNASEMQALAGEVCASKGVDSMAKSVDAIESAKQLSVLYNTAILMSGAVDVMIDGKLLQQSHYGSAMMPMITGTGCVLSAVVGAFHAVEKNRLAACVAAAAFYGICGERAASLANAPGSFKLAFIDELHLFAERGEYAENQ